VGITRNDYKDLTVSDGGLAARLASRVHEPWDELAAHEGEHAGTADPGSGRVRARIERALA
jgi:hypothetical protein